MKEINHFPKHRTDHPFHGEGSIWTHGMMVMTHLHCDAKLTFIDKKILLTVAILHDIGKVEVFQIKDEDKFTFNSHEGLSFYKAIDILESMEKEDDFYTNDIKLLILELVSLHGTSKFTAKCVCLISGEKEICRANDIHNINKNRLTNNELHILKKKFLFPVKEEGFEDVSGLPTIMSELLKIKIFDSNIKGK